jgi:hypothetical protein
MLELSVGRPKTKTTHSASFLMDVGNKLYANFLTASVLTWPLFLMLPRPLALLQALLVLPLSLLLLPQLFWPEPV